MMADGKRLHLQHGPIDIITQAFGDDAEVAKAYEQGISFFATVLQDLVVDLAELNQPVNYPDKSNLTGVSGIMWKATRCFSGEHFVTPMAAVAGAVADQVKQAMLAGRQLDKLYVNNGGDISLYLAGDAKFVSGIVNVQDLPKLDALAQLDKEDNVGGLATSGWRGRSLSPGIADAVTVLADTAAMADVAATLIAGDVWVDSPAIKQAPATSLRDDTDLGHMLITEDVGALSHNEIKTALERGLKTARSFQSQGLIKGAYLALQGETRNLSLTQIKTQTLTGKKVA